MKVLFASAAFVASAAALQGKCRIPPSSSISRPIRARHGGPSFSPPGPRLRPPPTTTTTTSVPSPSTSVRLGGWEPHDAVPRRMDETTETETETESKSGMTFFYSPSSLDHLSYFDLHENDLPEPIFSSFLSSDDSAVAVVDNANANSVAGAKSLSPPTPAPNLMSGLFDFGRQILSGGNGAGYDEASSDLASSNVRIVDIQEATKFVLDRPARLRCILEALERTSATSSGGGGEGEGGVGGGSSTSSAKRRRHNVVISKSKRQGRDISRAMTLLRRAHTQRYIDDLRSKAESIASATNDDDDDNENGCKIRPLSPRMTRTYIDERSFDAAVDAVADWIDAVNHVLMGIEAGESSSSGPAFALVRPPSHHACPTRGMGGCLLNSCAIAANHALETYTQTTTTRPTVAILDVDAHHGNGIAACVQDRKRIRYCSIHEEAVDRHRTRRGEPLIHDPRGPAAWDVGPNRNLLNVPLPTGTTWDDGYRDALVDVALPFLKESNPGLLLVACGFDALEEDGTSGLKLQVQDYAKLGKVLKEEFGNRVVFGLEGGYTWESGALGDAVVQLASAWDDE